MCFVNPKRAGVCELQHTINFRYVKRKPNKVLPKWLEIRILLCYVNDTILRLN